jgi:hypothetical protein
VATDLVWLINHTCTNISQLANREAKGFFKMLSPNAEPTCHRWGERLRKLSIKKFAKFVSIRKEVINTVLYVIYSMRFDVFPKNPGNTSAEIYEKQ